MPTGSTEKIPFEKLYQDGEKLGPLMPWNIGGPQPAVRTICDAGGFHGKVLDLGCGLGDNALYLASQGLRVSAVDISEVAVECGRDKARHNGVTVEFQVADAFSLATSGPQYDVILDSAFFHTLPAEESPRYTELLQAICNDGAELHLFTFSKELTPDYPGPRRVSESELREAFSADWDIKVIEATRYHSSLPVEAVAQMVDPRTFEVDAPTDNLSDQMVDEAGNVVSLIWHMHAVLRPQETRSETRA
ncbi:class I SAM-dependent methyltransferase [Streptomyces atratus]|uniref:class I SAM-dependent methyltransferase n=1 Tax=Streptomyces atratus TaxID=1893 RepID=UPI002252AE53|nr:class I SAM-dependent methyltransferase [Streptomyces atratus]MCX5339786.1 class I SAM-dependent methyltransferase [Streptomyces atratus]